MKDLNKRITNIVYNFFGRPVQIDFSDTKIAVINNSGYVLLGGAYVDMANAENSFNYGKFFFIDRSEDKKDIPDFGLGEYEENSQYSQRENTVRVANLFYEFITGTGPKHSLFTGGHPLTTQVKASYIVSIAKIQFNLNGYQGFNHKDIAFGVVGAGLTGNNFSAQFTGGACVSIFSTASGNLFVFDNTTGRYSFEAHSSPDIPRNRNMMTPEGNIY